MLCAKKTNYILSFKGELKMKECSFLYKYLIIIKSVGLPKFSTQHSAL